MPQVGFEPTISAGERPQTYAVDRAAAETGTSKHYQVHVIHYEIAEDTFRKFLSLEDCYNSVSLSEHSTSIPKHKKKTSSRCTLRMCIVIS